MTWYRIDWTLLLLLPRFQRVELQTYVWTVLHVCLLMAINRPAFKALYWLICGGGLAWHYLHNSVEEIKLFIIAWKLVTVIQHIRIFYTKNLNHCVYLVTFHFQLSIFSPNVLTSSPLELNIILLQIYLNFFTRFIPLLYHNIWKISVCITSYNS